jgi:sugar/nucleoside kinase (ribokinase family)
MTPAARVLGVGSPVVDLLVHVEEEFLETAGGEKGGMELVDEATMADLVTRLPAPPARATGGSAGNTLFALARLGVRAGLLGKLGADEAGRFYNETFAAAGGCAARFLAEEGAPTAQCLSLVTPDGERTMRTHLGAAMRLLPEEVRATDLQGVEHVHVEGYLLFNPDLILAVLESARAAGCTVSLDLASFEVVRAAQASLGDLLGYVGMVFANEEEAEAFSGESDPQAGLEALARHCPVAVVKCGRDGAYLAEGDSRLHVPAETAARVEDTTGAGDFWAAGFLFGRLNGAPLETCGRLGAHLGARVVEHLGAGLPGPDWPAVRERCEGMLA